MDERTWRLIGLSMLCVAVGVGLWWGFRSSPDPLPVELADGQTVDSTADVVDSEPPIVVVHVAGSVLRPGLVSLPEGSRVADAVAAAGGFTDEAVEMAVNLAAPVSDGMQVVIPSTAAPMPAGASGDGLVHVNRAEVGELETLPGVGPVLADRIASYRDEHGPFETIEDLLDVPGIGESKLESLRDSVAIP